MCDNSKCCVSYIKHAMNTTACVLHSDMQQTEYFRLTSQLVFDDMRCECLELDHANLPEVREKREGLSA